MSHQQPLARTGSLDHKADGFALLGRQGRLPFIHIGQIFYWDTDVLEGGLVRHCIRYKNAMGLNEVYRTTLDREPFFLLGDRLGPNDPSLGCIDLYVNQVLKDEKYITVGEFIELVKSQWNVALRPLDLLTTNMVTEDSPFSYEGEKLQYDRSCVYYRSPLDEYERTELAEKVFCTIKRDEHGEIVPEQKVKLTFGPMSPKWCGSYSITIRFHKKDNTRPRTGHLIDRIYPQYVRGSNKHVLYSPAFEFREIEHDIQSKALILEKEPVRMVYGMYEYRVYADQSKLTMFDDSVGYVYYKPHFDLDLGHNAEIIYVLPDESLGSYDEDVVVDHLPVKDIIPAIRAEAEVNEAYRQPIPYVVITDGDNVLLYSRTKAGGEAKLFDRCSIGFGGHMTVMPDHPDLATQDDLAYVIRRCIYKELDEEVPAILDLAMPDGKLTFRQSGKLPLTSLGTIRIGAAGSVDKVHLGLIYRFDIGDYTQAEKDKLLNCSGDQGLSNRVWVSKAAMREYYEKLEAWSKIAYDRLS